MATGSRNAPAFVLTWSGPYGGAGGAQAVLRWQDPSLRRCGPEFVAPRHYVAPERVTVQRTGDRQGAPDNGYAH
jgi:hypothetical protein